MLFILELIFHIYYDLLLKILVLHLFILNNKIMNRITKTITVLIFLFIHFSVSSQEATIGWFLNDADKSFEGYTLFSPLKYTKAYLIDNCGKEVKSWTSQYLPTGGTYLLEDGTLLRSGKILNSNFIIPGQGGIVERYDWNNNLLWQYLVSSDTVTTHHDITYMPNGNILLLIWKKYTTAEAIEMGRNPDLLGIDISLEQIWEIEPVGTDTANIVWKWKSTDHLIQNFDNTKPNYGNPSDNPGLLDFNYIEGDSTERSWLHLNSIRYNEDLDQIMLSCRRFSEIWIIDHSTTTEEAAGHTGGNYGKGGDIIYRWGNPEAYGKGTADDKKLFGQHNANWIPTGYPDENKIMVFNNGYLRPDSLYSEVDIIVPETDGNGNYLTNADGTFLPDTFFWSYTAPAATDLYSFAISTAQRLPNGNTLICSGVPGTFFEIEPINNDVVFKYINPVTQNGPETQGTVLTGNNASFSAYKYAPDYSGFNGQTLTPGNPIELDPLDYDCSTGNIAINTLNEKTVNIYPNPANKSVSVQNLSENEKYIVSISDMTGKVLIKTELLNNQNINISELNNGCYIMKISGLTYNNSLKLIINR